jgi:hypothetical protein
MMGDRVANWKGIATSPWPSVPSQTRENGIKGWMRTIFLGDIGNRLDNGDAEDEVA